VFAGSCGVTYGHHQIWQFLNKELYQPINIGDTIIGWRKAVKAEAAGEMQYLKKLMLSRPYVTRVGDQSMIKSSFTQDYKEYIAATRDSEKSYAMLYLPQNKSVSVDLSKVSGSKKNVWWFDPRNGEATPGKSVSGGGAKSFSPPKTGQDWVLVIDDASKNFKKPGTVE
jgi:hypothetical protein